MDFAELDCCARKILYMFKPSHLAIHTGYKLLLSSSCSVSYIRLPFVSACLLKPPPTVVHLVCNNLLVLRQTISIVGVSLPVLPPSKARRVCVHHFSSSQLSLDQITKRHRPPSTA